MTDRDDCIQNLIKASGGKLSRQEATDALDEMLTRAEKRGPSWKAMDERLKEAAAEMEDSLAERAAIARRNERMDALKAISRHKYYDRAPSPAQGLEAKLGGINVPFAGGRLSVDAQYKALRRQILGGFWLDLERAKTAAMPDGGLEKLFVSEKIEREWAAELHELNKPKGGKPGISTNKEALAIAEVIHKWQKVGIERINGEGGWVKSYSGYITRTSHDADRIRRAGRERWIEDVMKGLDVEKTFHDGDPNQARKLLHDMWPQFVTGDHFDYTRPLDDISSVIDVDFARRASAPRELHWKGSDEWRAYNASYGRFNPTFAVTHAFDNAAKVTALMKEFGATPRKALEEDLFYLRGKYKDNVDAITELETREGFIRSLFAEFDGASKRPVNATFARIMSDVRSVTRMSKLGLTPYAMFSDLATKASELRYQGMSVPERFGSTLSDYFRGAEGGEKRQLADLMLQAVDSEIGQIAQRFDSGGVAHDVIARAEQRFFRWTAISAMTFNQRHRAEQIMARHMGMERGKVFSDLGAPEQRVLSLFDIGKAEWDVLHKVAWNEINGSTYLTPEVATRLSDADVKGYLIATGKLHKDASGQSVDFAVKRARDDLGVRLASYFADRGEFAVLEPGARERARFSFSGNMRLRPGTVGGEALRLFMQFKQFPATMMMKTWSREIYGGQGRADKIAGLTEFVVYATMLGVVANGLNQLTKGQDPFSKWKNEPAGALLAGFIRGGAASIYGDFLLGEWSRHGLVPSAAILGPVLGQIDQVSEIWSDLTHMNARKATGMLGLRMARDNTPFANMIYTKYAVDALIYWRMAEWMSPGFLERHERTMKDKQGIEYLDQLRPTRVAR